MWGPLLCFNDPALERAFWHSPLVRHALCSVDSLATLLIFAQNAALLAVAISAEEGIVPSGLLHIFLACIALLFCIQALVAWLAWARQDFYCRQRDAFMALQRVVRAAASLYFSFRIEALPLWHSYAAALVADEPRPPLVHFCILRLLLTRGYVCFSCLFVFLFPARFRYSCVLHTLMVPCLLHCASCLVSVFQMPIYRAAVCEIATSVHLSLPGSCHRLTAHVVAYSSAVSVGYVTPLFFAYIIEARHKCRFSRQLGIAPPPGTFVGIGDIRYDSAKDVVTMLILYFNLLMLTHLVTVAGVTYLHPPPPRL